MKKYLILLLLPISLISCDNIGSTRVKNLIDLTPRLEVESESVLKIKSGAKNNLSFNKKGAKKISSGRIIAKPVFAKNTVYNVDNMGYASAFSLKSNKNLWRVDISNYKKDRNFSSGGMLFSNDKLYITNGSRDLIILDSSNGHEIMRKEFPDILRSKPIFVNKNILLLQTINNQLIAYDAKSTQFAWMIEGTSEIISIKNHVHPVSYKEEYAIVGFSSGELLMVDTNNGEIKWRYNLSENIDISIPGLMPSTIVNTPIIEDNYAYFATSNGEVVKLDLDNGAPAWSKKADDILSISLVNDYLFVTTNARQIAALSSHNGEISWVGNLISEKERKKKRPNTALFQDPFLSKTDKGFAINVVSSIGELFQFQTDASGVLKSIPEIISIEKNVMYQHISCCSGELLLITDSYIK